MWTALPGRLKWSQEPAIRLSGSDGTDSSDAGDIGAPESVGPSPCGENKPRKDKCFGRGDIVFGCLSASSQLLFLLD